MWLKMQAVDNETVQVINAMDESVEASAGLISEELAVWFLRLPKCKRAALHIIHHHFTLVVSFLSLFIFYCN